MRTIFFKNIISTRQGIYIIANRIICMFILIIFNNPKVFKPIRDSVDLLQYLGGSDMNIIGA